MTMPTLIRSFLLAAALLGAPAALVTLPAPAAVAASAAAMAVQVLANHDGDTLTVRLDGGAVEKVRLLGIDTAEIAQGLWGAKAREFTAGLTRNQRVKLVFDVQQRDRYGRLLAYVYLPDGRMLNLELVKQGYAMVLTYPPNVAHTDEFVKAQRQARDRGLNIWGADGLKESPREFRHKGGHGAAAPSPAPARPQAAAGTVSLNTRSLKYHEPGCRAYDCEHCERMSLQEAVKRGGKPCGMCH